MDSQISCVLTRYSDEIASLCKVIRTSRDEEELMKVTQSLELKSDSSSLQILLILKSLTHLAISKQSLQSLLQVFVRKAAVVVDEVAISKNETGVTQALTVVKDFWSLMSNQHAAITKQMFGRYSPDLYKVLPSLASVYVDLFVAVHGNKQKTKKLSKRLCSWLMFELNERCLKTALLEVSACTKEGARLLLPLLRKLLSEPPQTITNMDYLLHFILLKKWSFVCVELVDLLQTNLDIKAPKHFVEWLQSLWPQAKTHLPTDKSLKGRRVSEFLLALEQRVVEELVNVFSECLLSEKQTAVNGHTQASATQDSKGGGEDELFIIDKRGGETEDQLASDMPPSKKRKKRKSERANEQKKSSFKSKATIDGNSEEDMEYDSDMNILSQTSSKNKLRSERSNKQKKSSSISEPMIDTNSEEDMEYDSDMYILTQTPGKDTESDDDDNFTKMKTNFDDGLKESRETVSVSSKEEEKEDNTELQIMDQQKAKKHDDTAAEAGLGFCVDRTPKKSFKKTDTGGGTLTSGRDPVSSYFIDRSSKRESSDKGIPNISEDEPVIEVIDGTDIQAFSVHEDAKSVEKVGKGPLETKVSTGKANSPVRKQVLSPQNSQTPIKNRRRSKSSSQERDDGDSGHVSVGKVKTAVQSHSPKKERNLESEKTSFSQSVIVSSDENDDDVVIVSDSTTSVSSPSKQTPTEKLTKVTASKLHTISTDSVNWKDLADSVRTSRRKSSRSESESNVQELSLSPLSSGKTMIAVKDVNKTPEKKGPVNEAQIGLILSQLRKSSSTGKLSHAMTRLRTKSESEKETPLNEKKSDKKHSAIMAKEKSPTNIANTLKDWLIKSPSTRNKNLDQTLGDSSENRQRNGDTVRKPKRSTSSENEISLDSTNSTSAQQQSPKTKRKRSESGSYETTDKSSHEATSSPTKKQMELEKSQLRETSSGATASPFKTGKIKDKVLKSPSTSSKEDSLDEHDSKSASLKKVKKTPPTNRYFLRTNCSHRTYESDTVCLTCSLGQKASPSSKTSSPGNSEQVTPTSTRSRQKSSPSSSQESPKKSPSNRRKSLRSASKGK